MVKFSRFLNSIFSLFFIDYIREKSLSFCIKVVFDVNLGVGVEGIEVGHVLAVSGRSV